MKQPFKQFEKATQEDILSLEQALKAVQELLEKNDLVGVVVAYKKGGAGGSAVCLEADFSRINVKHDDGVVFLGPFNKKDLADDSQTIEENITAIRAISNMLNEQANVFGQASAGVIKMMEHIGITMQMDSDEVSEIPAQDIQ